MEEEGKRREGKREEGKAEEEQWSSAVEDLVDRGDVDGAISLLESLVSKLETLEEGSRDLRLASALSDLADLYSSRGLSLKADGLRSRALLIKLRSQQPRSPVPLGDPNNAREPSRKSELEENRAWASDASPSADCDDWEAIADLASNEIFSPQVETRVSSLTLEETEFQTPKRRGRGSFLYKKNGMYSDQVDEAASIDNSEDEFRCQNSKEAADIRNSRYGTSHVLVLADFPPSTQTTDLEKVFEKFRDHGVVIRWVNDTVALAVFRNPSMAKEALNTAHCPFIIRSLDENDRISAKDLEPPYPRPKTSTRTAQRLIAQGMGRKLSTTFGSSEFKEQEEARKNRIHTRQIMRDEAWGPDDP